jgi:diguanylate cyclase (GGDEF)-like protein
MSNPLFDEIASTALFAGVSFDAIERLLENCQVLDAQPDQVLLEPGKCNSFLYVVLQGQLDVHLMSLSDPSYLRLVVGDCAGEMSMIDGREASAFVRVSTPSRLLVIPMETMWSLINASHALARNMLVTLSGRVRYGNDAVKQSFHRQSEFESLAYVDGLTGLHNRRWLDQAFRRQVERGLRDTRPLSILMLDIDHFKRYNDTYGHLAGDRALRAVALILTDNLRPGDLLARYGGEEFSVLLPDTEAAQACAIAERLRHAVSLPRPDQSADMPTLSISLGETQLRPEDTLEKILERADAAMYQAKTAGRNCVRSA